MQRCETYDTRDHLIREEKRTMKVILTRAARIRHEAGETVTVSPAEARFLISTGSAFPADVPDVETPETKTVEKPAGRKGKTSK